MSDVTTDSRSESSGLPVSKSPGLPVSSSPPLPLSPAPSFAGTAAHVIMFWVLTGLALAVFTPCALVPIYQDVEQARDYRQQMAVVVDDLKARAKKNQDRIDGLREDPLVNERIARRELNYGGDQEQIVRMSGRELSALRVDVPEILDRVPTDFATVSSSTHWIHVVMRWLPAWPYRRLFGDANNRMLLMLMSAGLLVSAFVLYGKNPAPRREPGGP